MANPDRAFRDGTQKTIEQELRIVVCSMPNITIPFFKLRALLLKDALAVAHDLRHGWALQVRVYPLFNITDT
jgi:hypothetical protein